MCSQLSSTGYVLCSLNKRKSTRIDSCLPSHNLRDPSRRGGASFYFARDDKLSEGWLIETRSAPALTRCYPHSFIFHLGNPFPRFVVKELRRASNETTLRAFAMLTVSSTFEIFRRPDALRRRVDPGQSRRIGLDFSPDPLTVRTSVFTFLPYGSDNYFSSDKKASELDRTNRGADRRVAGTIDSRTTGACSHGGSFVKKIHAHRGYHSWRTTRPIH